MGGLQDQDLSVSRRRGRQGPSAAPVAVVGGEERADGELRRSPGRPAAAMMRRRARVRQVKPSGRNGAAGVRRHGRAAGSRPRTGGRCAAGRRRRAGPSGR
jgi:hypothetical protein